MDKRAFVIQPFLSRERRPAMKTMIGIFLLVVLFAIPAFGEDEEIPYNYAIK